MMATEVLGLQLLNSSGNLKKPSAWQEGRLKEWDWG